MLSDKNRSELEQSQAFLTEYYPSMWAGLYANLKKREEFTDAQAFELLKVYVSAQAFGTAGGKGM